MSGVEKERERDRETAGDVLKIQKNEYSITISRAAPSIRTDTHRITKKKKNYCTIHTEK